MAKEEGEAAPKYLPPHGQPLGSNLIWKVGALFVIPVLRLVTKPVWRGVENIPSSGAVIVASNHISYIDPLIFAHFLYRNARAVRFLGKASLFRIPLLGWVLRQTEQVPVEREVEGAAAMALSHAAAALRAGHCVGVYPEGTLTRDPSYWPMVAKTGLARLAVVTRVPVIPCAQWGAAEILSPYTKRPKLWPRTTVTVIAGEALDLSPWFGKEEDHQAMVEATAYIMRAITALLSEIRVETPPGEIFDPHLSGRPRIGNAKKRKNK